MSRAQIAIERYLKNRSRRRTRFQPEHDVEVQRDPSLPRTVFYIYTQMERVFAWITPQVMLVAIFRSFKMPRFKDDDIRDVILAIIALIIIEGAIFLAVPQPSAPAAQLAKADDTWKW